MQVTVELPVSLLARMGGTPERLAQEFRVAAAVHWYLHDGLNASMAAEVAGLSRLAFLDELARRKIDVLKVDLDQLRDEIG